MKRKTCHVKSQERLFQAGDGVFKGPGVADAEWRGEDERRWVQSQDRGTGRICKVTIRRQEGLTL